MAWNVVIAGGGFAGASAARELERLLPKQSARLILVNDVNFMLYTPFLPEAAAGTLEPRHVVTPLRDILRRTNLRLGAICGHDPAARTVELCGPTRARRGRCATTSSWSRSGSVSRSLPIPGSTEHAIGFKSLADAIWLRNHVIETLEQANATEDPARREELLTYVFVGGGYSGLEALAELQDFAADAMDRYPRARLHGMRWILVEAMDRVLPEVPADLADYALRELRGRGIDIRLGTRLEEAARRLGAALDRRGDPDPDPGLDRRRRAASEPRQPRAAARRRGRVRGRRAHAGRGPRRRLGDRRLRRRPGPERGRARLPADRAAGRPPGAGGRPQHRRRARRRDPAAARSATGPRRRSSTSAATRRSARSAGLKFRGFLAWWMARTYHMSQIPGLAPQGPRRGRLDRRPAVSPRHRRGRLDRPPAPAARRGLRPRRHPPPGGRA